MNPPSVAIVGRPNVGKSTLFNALVRRRVAIVDPSSGVTRDRISYVIAAPDGARLELVDTGGMGVRGALRAHVESQIRRAVESAAALVFVVDAETGLVPQDREIAARIRTLGKPILLVVNKADTPAKAAAAAEFHRLGLGEPLPVSALHRIDIGELRDRLFAFAGARPAAPPEPELRIAIVGQRSVGKSTLINALAREQRVIVSEIPGTTRDSVDVRFELDGRAFVAIDTAGQRKARRVATSVEFFSRVRAQESIRRADVVLLMLDPRGRISQVDKAIADYIAEHAKPCVIVVNKWDLAGRTRTGQFADYLTVELPLLSYAPVCFISALRNQRVQATIDLARSLWDQARIRVSTADLNAAIEDLKTRPHAGGGPARRAKVYYATQVGTVPPTIVLFVNSPGLFTQTYRRAIAAFLRRRLPFHEVPVVVKYRKAGAREN